MSEPRCPMGHQMELFQVASGSWRYGCIECATSYKAIKRRQYGWVSPMKSTKVKAREAAMKRKIERPLKLEELKKTAYQIPCWIEGRGGELFADVIDRDSIGMFSKIGTLTAGFAIYCDTKAYGKDWRCWKNRPTDEERAAAKWEVNAYEESRNNQEYGQAP